MNDSEEAKQMESMDTPAYTKPCGALLFVDEDSSDHDRLRLTVAAPNNLYTALKRPVILKGDFHSFTRPFDWVTKFGGKDPGEVTYFLLELGHPTQTAALFSISLAGGSRVAPDHRLGGRRVLIFPGWGPGMLRSGLKPSKKDIGTHAHHITIEADTTTGEVTSHITSSRKPNGKPAWPRLAKKIRVAGVESLLVGTLLVKRPSALEPSGIAVATGISGEGQSGQMLEQRLGRHLSEAHPILELPPGIPWDSNGHLQIHFIISPSGKLAERQYPVLTVKNPRLFSEPAQIPDEIMYRFTKIELSSTANFIVAYAIVPGRLTSDFYW